MNGLLFFYVLIFPVLLVLRMVGIVKVPYWILIAPLLILLVMGANLMLLLVLLEFA